LVVLNRIYTKTGDDGTTALGSGERRLKSDLRVDAYGTVDETNAAIGIARLHLKNEPDVDAIMNRVQNDLFDLGADFAVPEGESAPKERLRVIESQVERLEAEIDKLNASLKPLRSFVLPGGEPSAAYLHLARTICRRAERSAWAASKLTTLNSDLLRYLNRLSDLLFVMARYLARRDGGQETLWRRR
jgi:cob(I)alamin adenosyltransferase